MPGQEETAGGPSVCRLFPPSSRETSALVFLILQAREAPCSALWFPSPMQPHATASSLL